MHELSAAFAQVGLPLNFKLAEMLDEHFSHRTERRGCGYAQATRWLATLVNQPRDRLDACDLLIFDDWNLAKVNELAHALMARGAVHGWRGLDRPQACDVLGVLPDEAPMLEELRGLDPLMQVIANRLQHGESHRLLGMMRDLLGPGYEGGVQVPAMEAKSTVGSCPQAEEFFLEIAHRRVRRGGAVNIVVSASGEPLLLEKLRLGESHSAVSLAPIVLNGVLLPPGSLCAIGHAAGFQLAWARTPHGHIVPIGDIAAIRFLRLTTLSVEPNDRLRAFSVMVQAQHAAGLFSPLTTTLAQLCEFAASELASIR
ncbi:MAG TPA: hypothetical protein VGV14_04165 [Rhodanobacter sp.]|nr:hypothetical protein [Rhodanobacter sp.]